MGRSGLCPQSRSSLKGPRLGPEQMAKALTDVTGKICASRCFLGVDKLGVIGFILGCHDPARDQELPDPLGRMIELDAFTRLCRGERNGLRWQDVDFEKLVLQIRRFADPPLCRSVDLQIRRFADPSTVVAMVAWAENGTFFKRRSLESANGRIGPRE
jgi:hypothetical protein